VPKHVGVYTSYELHYISTFVGRYIDL